MWLLELVVLCCVVVFVVVVVFLRFGLVCGALVMSLCACSVAWSEAMVSMLSEVSPL